MTSDDITTLLESARLAATEAGAMLRERWQQPQRLRQKGFRDWVTDSDLAAQDLIARHIQARHPGHAFLAEEDARALPLHGEVRWIVDPIDGTTNFSRRQPNFCVSIAAVTRKRTLAGVIYDPLRDELFSATEAGAGHLNGERLRCSETSTLDDSVICLDWAHHPTPRQATLDSLQRLAHEVRSLRSIGSAALGLAWVAAGRLDGYWNWRLNAWDLAAGALLVERAGGRCTTIDNRAPARFEGASSCLATNGHLHTMLQAQLDPQR